MTNSTDSAAKYVAPSREGKILIGGHFEPDIKRQLKTIAAAEDTTLQALLAEAIQDVIAKHSATR